MIIIMERKKLSKTKLAIIILVILLLCSIGGLTARYVYLKYFAPTQGTVTIPNNQIGDELAGIDEPNPKPDLPTTDTPGTDNSDPGQETPVVPEQKVTKLELYKGHPGDNERFEVHNLFPGDLETKYFCVKTYHHADIRLYFRATVTEETKALGDVLHIKVTHLDTGKVLCDAPFSTIKGEEFSEVLYRNAEEETSSYYRVDVSLDTSVGNEYQAAKLLADFEWFIKDDGLNPKTGDDITVYPWLILGAGSLILILLLLLILLGRHRREKNDER